MKHTIIWKETVSLLTLEYKWDTHRVRTKPNKQRFPQVWVNIFFLLLIHGIFSLAKVKSIIGLTLSHYLDMIARGDTTNKLSSDVKKVQSLWKTLSIKNL